jgi:trehalose 6-phosphate phosphatase
VHFDHNWLVQMPESCVRSPRRDDAEDLCESVAVNLTQPSTDAGKAALSAVLADPAGTLVGVDYDGTIAPIVPDPEHAKADEAAVQALGRLGSLVGHILVLTGRPAETAVGLGGFRHIEGLSSMILLGQYGVERWDARSDSYHLPPRPAAIDSVARELPSVLERHGAGQARVEYKGRALGVHTRKLPEPAGTLQRLTEPLADLAARHDLRLELGKNVLEIRPPGVDKGGALLSVVSETRARQVIFAGDDLGDLPAFHAVQQLRARGTPGLLVCSASAEEDALATISDVIVDGPGGIAAWLTDLAEAMTAAASSAAG